MIVEKLANTQFELSPPLVAELRARATRLGVEASVLMHTAWECSKHALLEREAAKQEPSGEVTLSASRPPRALKPAHARSPLKLSGYPLKCAFKLPPELTSELLTMKLAFDRPAAWLLTEAYLLARDRLG